MKQELIQANDRENIGVCLSSSVIEQKEMFPMMIDFNNLFSDDKHEACVARILNEQYNNFKIYDGDLLIVKLREDFIDGKLVLVRFEGELSIKKCKQIDDVKYLINAEGIFLPLHIENCVSYQILGVVSKIIHYL